MPHLIKSPEPGEKQEVLNAFEGIKNTPNWHKWRDAVILAAAILTIVEIFYRYFPA
jgi:hypothetical protein